MNDLHRHTLGILGTAAGWVFAHANETAAFLASAATAVFMGLSAWEKWRNRNKPPAQ